MAFKLKMIIMLLLVLSEIPASSLYINFHAMPIGFLESNYSSWKAGGMKIQYLSHINSALLFGDMSMDMLIPHVRMHVVRESQLSI